jgi:hypothetical protein
MTQPVLNVVLHVVSRHPNAQLLFWQVHRYVVRLFQSSLKLEIVVLVEIVLLVIELD